MRKVRASRGQDCRGVVIGEQFETLEARVHLSAVDSGPGWASPLTWTGSEIPIEAPSVNKEGSGVAFSLTSAHSLINLDDFRADPRFSGIDGTGYSAVVIDSGIDRDHPFFGPDKNKNKIADRIVYSYDFADGDRDASDVDGHGTNVSSIIGSSDAEYPGVAPGVNLIHLKVFGNSGVSKFSHTERALKWVISNAKRYNIVTVNLSLGGDAYHQTYTTDPAYGIADELAALAAMDVIVCAAAGNDFRYNHSAQGFSYPAADPNVLAVGAVYDRNVGKDKHPSGTATKTGPDRITPFSQRSTSMWQIFAPGAFIPGATEDGGVGAASGTSQAAPHVAGTVVLMQQLAERITGKRLSLASLRDLMWKTGKKIVDGDDERDNVANTGGKFRRLDVMALANAVWKLGGPEVRVTFGNTVLLDDEGRVTFGSTDTFTSVVKVITVENTGTKPLTLSNLSAGAGFTIVSPFGSRKLAPGGSTQFSVRMDAVKAGNYKAQVRFRTNDRDEKQFNFTVEGSVRTVVKIADDGTNTVSFSGDWTVGTGGYANDHRVKAPGEGWEDAEWAFLDLLPGMYRVYTTWKAGSNLASNARYTIDDGFERPVRVRVNQRIAPDDIKSGGVWWHELGTFTVTDSVLSVRLDDKANGRVMADAVRIERVGGVTGGPRIHVTEGRTALLDDDEVRSFGSTTSGRPVERTLTVRNVGDRALVLADLVQLPAGFSLVEPPTKRLKPGTSTTIKLRLDAGAAGEFGGVISLASNDVSGVPFRVNVAGKVNPFIRTVDDGDAAFTAEGGWSTVDGLYRNDSRLAAPWSPDAAATWTFTRLPAGVFRVWATWAGSDMLDLTRSAFAPYTIIDGGDVIGQVTADQRTAPSHGERLNTPWAILGDFRIESGTLVVQLGAAGDGFVSADGLYIERIAN